MKKRYLIIYKGQVQGVGFRFTVQQLANKYNLTGFVYNEDDGSVKVEIQGNNNDIDAFIKESLQNRGFIDIEDYALKQIDVDEYDSMFIVYY